MSQEVAIPNDALDMSHLSASICAELAAGLADAEGIKEKYKLSDGQWIRLKSTPIFRSMLKDAIYRFKGDLNAGKRIMLKSEILLEDSLAVLHGIINDKDGAASNKLDSIKQLTALAQKGGRQMGEGGAAGGGFSVNIHIDTGGGNDAVGPVIIEQDED